LGGAFFVFFFFIAPPTRRWRSSSPLSGAFTRRSTIGFSRVAERSGATSAATRCSACQSL